MVIRVEALALYKKMDLAKNQIHKKKIMPSVLVVSNLDPPPKRKGAWVRDYVSGCNPLCEFSNLKMLLDMWQNFLTAQVTYRYD